MSFKQNILRKIRNLLYRHHRYVERKFNQANRALLKITAPRIDPINEAPQITNRKTDDSWETLQPIWVLSTGRTGTNTLTRLLKLSPEIDAFHEPAPELFQFSYDYYKGNIETFHALQTLVYLRDELVFRSYRDGFIFVETNNRLTYVADLLLEIFPASKFIHIYRNPYDFIRSGMRRNYYRGHMRDYARIKPTAGDNYYKRWNHFTDLEKVAWNWKKVNNLCLNFLAGVPDSQKMSFSSETFFSANPELISKLFDFIGSVRYQPPLSDINRVMKKKYNAQKKGRFSTAENWSSVQIKKVNRIISPVSRKLSYKTLSS